MIKKILFCVLIYIFILNFSYSQTTYIPDDVFEQTLIDLGYDHGPLDNIIKTANLDKVTYLDISNKKIKDFTGIEDFINLQTLVYNNSLSNILKESKRNAFIELSNRSSSLIELNVSRNGNLLFNNSLVFNLTRN